MTDLLSRVTPRTCGLIWFPKDEIDTVNPFYQAVDYLLDGMLTSHLASHPELSSRIIVGENFGRPFYVMIVRKLVAAEVEGLQTLLKGELKDDSDILVIDETDQSAKLEKAATKLRSHLRLLR